MAFGTTTSAYEMDGVGAVNSAADQISQLKGIAQKKQDSLTAEYHHEKF